MEDVKALALAKAKGRSPLYTYMRKNFAGFQEMLAEMGRVDWAAIAAALAEAADVRDGAGNRPTKTTVRQTWHKVKTDVARGVAGKRPRPTPGSAVKSGAVEIVRKVEPQPTSTPEQDDEDEEIFRQLRRGTVFEHMHKPKERK